MGCDRECVGETEGSLSVRGKEHKSNVDLVEETVQYSVESEIPTIA